MADVDPIDWDNVDDELEMPDFHFAWVSKDATGKEGSTRNRDRADSTGSMPTPPLALRTGSALPPAMQPRIAALVSQSSGTSSVHSSASSSHLLRGDSSVSSTSSPAYPTPPSELSSFRRKGMMPVSLSGTLDDSDVDRPSRPSDRVFQRVVSAPVPAPLFTRDDEDNAKRDHDVASTTVSTL